MAQTLPPIFGLPPIQTLLKIGSLKDFAVLCLMMFIAQMVSLLKHFVNLASLIAVAIVAFKSKRSQRSISLNRVEHEHTAAGTTAGTVVNRCVLDRVGTFANTRRNCRFFCEKCGCTQFTTSEIRTCSNIVAKVLNVQNRRFLTVTCEGCGINCKCF